MVKAVCVQMWHGCMICSCKSPLALADVKVIKKWHPVFSPGVSMERLCPALLPVWHCSLWLPHPWSSYLLSCCEQPALGQPRSPDGKAWTALGKQTDFPLHCLLGLFPCVTFRITIAFSELEIRAGVARNRKKNYWMHWVKCFLIIVF